MSANIVQVSDILEPAIWNEYFIEDAIAKNAILNSGIAAIDPEVTQKVGVLGDGLINMPFWDDLSHDTGTVDRSKVPTDDTAVITPASMTTDKDIAITNYRTQSWKMSDVVKYKAGDDPVEVAIAKYSFWWSREYQRLLLKVLSGVFATTLATSHTKDIASETGLSATAANLISFDAVEDTRFLLGDAYDKLSGMIVHSVVYKRMRKLNLIDVVPDANQNVNIPTYNGLRVIVDDGITTVAGSVNGTKYTTYLFGQGAVAFNPIPLNEPSLEPYRIPNQSTGAGTTELITRQKFLLHLRGVKFTSNTLTGLYPSDSELALGANWSKVYLDKNIRIARLITNG